MAAVALAALVEDGHSGAAFAPTGPAALTYFEVAETLSLVLRRPIRYANPGLLRSWQEVRRRADVPGNGATGIYTLARLGRAGSLTGDVERGLVDPRSACSASPRTMPAPGRGPPQLPG